MEGPQKQIPTTFEDQKIVENTGSDFAEAKRIPTEFTDQKIVENTGSDFAAESQKEIAVDSAFEKLKESLMNPTPEISAEVVAEEKERQQAIAKQKQRDVDDIKAIREKLRMDPEDTIPV